LLALLQHIYEKREGSGAGSGSVPLTNGSGAGSRKLKNIRIRIPITGIIFSGTRISIPVVNFFIFLFLADK
jgi:hypothetical protein